jgi:hypothetical protein
MAEREPPLAAPPSVLLWVHCGTLAHATALRLSAACLRCSLGAHWANVRICRYILGRRFSAVPGHPKASAVRAERGVSSQPYLSRRVIEVVGYVRLRNHLPFVGM